MVTSTMKLWSIILYHKELVGFQVVLEKKLVLMVKMPGVYLEYINLRRLSSLLSVILRTVGMNLRK